MTTRDPVVVRDREILGGRPVFRGTRVQAEILFENLADGYSISEIIENFPTLDRDDLSRVLIQACDLVMSAAPEIAHLEPADAGLPGRKHAAAASSESR